MSDDLKPRSIGGLVRAMIGTAIAAGTTVWGVTGYLHSRASTDDIKALTSNSFRQQLDNEVFKGEFKAINIRLESLERTALEKAKEDRRERRAR